MSCALHEQYVVMKEEDDEEEKGFRIGRRSSLDQRGNHKEPVVIL